MTRAQAENENDLRAGASAQVYSWRRLLAAAIAYLTTCVVGALAIGIFDFFDHGYWSLRFYVLRNGAVLVGVLALVPFLLAKAAMHEAGRDGWFDHAQAGALAAVLIGLLVAAMMQLGSASWIGLLSFFAGVGVLGAMCGTTYWVVRQIGRRALRGWKE
jgi:hypothetical protein